MPGSPCEIFQTTFDVSKVKVEDDIDIKEMEDVKTEKIIGNEEEKWINIKEEDDDIHSEEEANDGIHTNEEEDVDGKEVS
jgi:hypothetical protein